MRWVPRAPRALAMRPSTRHGRALAAVDVPRRQRRCGRATTTTATVADHERGRRGRRGRAAAARGAVARLLSRRTTERSAPRPQSHFPPESPSARAHDSPVRAAQIISRRAPCRRHARGPGDRPPPAPPASLFSLSENRASTSGTNVGSPRAHSSDASRRPRETCELAQGRLFSPPGRSKRATLRETRRSL